jgi:hypothetical protein
MTVALLCLASAAIGGVIGFALGATLVFANRSEFVVVSAAPGTAPEQDADTKAHAEHPAESA